MTIEKGRNIMSSRRRNYKIRNIGKDNDMEIITNQTLYKCSYCNRRKLTKRGCIQHENNYCSAPSSPHKIRAEKERIEKQSNCKHLRKETIWGYIPGECVKQPDYDICIYCNKIF